MAATLQHLPCTDLQRTTPCLHDLPCDLLVNVLLQAAGNDAVAVWRWRHVCRSFQQAADQVLPRMAAACLTPAALPPFHHSPRPVLQRRILCHHLINRLAGVRALNLSGAHAYFTDQLLRALCATCGRLEVLRIDHCQKLSSKAGKDLRKLTELRQLSAANCGALFEDGGAVLTQLPALTHLDVSWCRCVNNATVRAVGPQLRSLVVHGCELLDSAICSALPHVEFLDIAFTAVCDAGLEALAEGCPRLHTLVLAAQQHNLWSTGKWTPRGLDHFRQAAPAVTVRCVSS